MTLANAAAYFSCTKEMKPVDQFLDGQSLYVIAPGSAGKEVVLQYSSDLASGRSFSTDANGREMQVRQAGCQ